ncbi:hypothetical protein [Neisseria montereyensis]|uniref:Uncharacterized protein n=1 Tax=Neisseria montereyensis TaxID=2973938 RepID=A0ABT2FCX7_9NEIS|nr:hypothetical protein [Neisseria montereyensis]MCS4534011.1 hypothetical protein [Neisseria montereyensis]
MVRYFKEESTHITRAIQVWLILLSAAMNRQTMTYTDLSVKMYEHYAAGVLGGILEYIAVYCNQNELPPLTAIVVNKETGLPGLSIPVEADLNRVREQVYQFDWYSIFPPTEQEFENTKEK